MERQRVESSTINSVGYEKEKHILEIKFNSGGIYQYYGVPENEYYCLINDSSIGSYHAKNIKDNFECHKI